MRRMLKKLRYLIVAAGWAWCIVALATLAFGTTTVTVGTGSGGIGTSTINITASMVGANTLGTLNFFPPIISNANSPCQTQIVNLSSGANTVTVQALSGGMIFIPPTSNAQTLTLKGVSGDTGIGLYPTAPFLLTFTATPPASVVITAGGTVNGCQVVFF